MFAGNNWLFVDSLSVYHILVMLLIYLLSTLYSLVYLQEEITHGDFGLKQIKIYASLWCESLAAMTLVLISNNLAIMWVGMETTTLVTAFLISIHVTSVSLEAMWKYLLICSVGVAFAFMGTLLAAASAQGLHIPAENTLLWTELLYAAPHLNVHLLKFAFIFVLVGFGTKAGLAPMHNWLPDAHSQAPAPVSAIFSGFMLNAALYCIIRYIPIVETATGHTGWVSHLLLIFGTISILVASAFILMQHDLKRLLAYHSIEHLGIIVLGLGLGGIGVFAALFHILNHSICKTLSFFAAGRLGQFIGTHDMRKMAGIRKISPIWSIGIFGSLLA
ncbi:MAG: hydrogenase 4 subunit F, partial [Deltaproteobacteria bacterium]|nr:hydrogenase 4 subunit F [Deltaproteobacteria bacterium]